MKVCPRCSELYADAATRCTRDNRELRAVNDPLIGRTIGARYRLISRLGAGGMSSVYLARHVLIDRLMAIKILRRDLASFPIHRDRFLREARAVNRINHENIVEITDFGETEDGLVYLVMEYIAGESLHLVIKKGPLALERGLAIAQQVAGALGRAHQMGVIHRDLKPENILLVERRGRSDFVKILDFGIAKIIDAPSLTGNHQIFGTPGYIAPEYILNTTIDGRSDLYSLGVVLYEIVTAKLPHDYQYPGDLLVKHATEAPIPPSKRLPSLPRAVDEVILRCLAKEPADRFRDAFALQLALRQCAELVSGGAHGWGALDDTRASLPESPVLPRTLAGPEIGEASGRPAPDVSAGMEQGRTLVDSVASVQEQLAGADALPLEPAADPPAVRHSTGVIISPMPGSSAASEIDELRPSLSHMMMSQPVLFDAAADAEHIVAAWRRRYDAVRDYLDDVEDVQPAPAEVAHAMALSTRVMEELEERIAACSALQQRLDELQAHGRDFRATIGRALDELGRDLAQRLEAHDRSSTARDALERDRAALKQQPQEEASYDEGRADALLWESAALEADLASTGAEVEDLQFQLDTLRAQLERLNVALENDLVQLTERLEQDLVRLHETARAMRAPLDSVAQYLESAATRLTGEQAS